MLSADPESRAGGRRAILLALLVLVPLAPNPDLFTNSDAPKAALLLAGVLLLLGHLFFRAVLSRQETKVLLPVPLLVAGFLVSAGLLLATRAPDRGATLLGLAQIGSLLAFAILVARYLGDDANAIRALLVCLAAAAAAAIFGVVGWPWGRSSTFGNPSFAAEYVAGALPIALAMWLGGRPRAALGAGALLLAFLVVAKSRADWLGAAAGLTLVGLLLLLSRRDRPPAFAALLAGLLLTGAVALPWLFDVVPLPTFGRSDTVAVRRHIREAAVEIGLDHPLSGVGLGGFPAFYPAYRHPAEASLSLGREVTFAHNLPAQVLAETGFPGLALLLFFLGGVLFGGLRAIFARPGDVVALGATGGVFAIVVSAQFSAPLRHPGSALLFFALAGLIAARRPRRYVTRLKGRHRRTMPVLVLLAPPLVGLFLAPARLNADRLYARAVALEVKSGGEMDQEIADLLERSVAAAPTPAALRQLALYETLTDRPAEALARLDTLFGISPYDPPGKMERARALLALGRSSEAAKILRDLEKARPEDHDVQFLLGLAELKGDDPARATPALLAALRSLPPDAARRYAGRLARLLPKEARDGFLAQVSLWPDTDRALTVLAAFGTGRADLYRAFVLARVGRLDDAMDALHAAVKAGVVDKNRLLYDPRLEPLRDRADYDDLLK